MIALPAPSRRFEDAATAFPRRLHNFFTIEELSHPIVPVVDAARLARATYMRDWHTRARENCIRTCKACIRSLRCCM